MVKLFSTTNASLTRAERWCRWLSHRWSDWSDITYPPVNADYTQLRFCLRCGNYETR